ncbi:helix-turn-helix domain-containing protein [Streptomyces sp. NPDC048172]|uniref:helix-turn-helix domain-containing protein n=1 Tax=Streptomyces sp. NPDC048172 TaxID=3365505 RepID=UPI0037148D3A
MPVGPTTRRRQLAAELRRLRSQAGMTLEEAGTAGGTSRAALARYESPQGSSAPKWPIVDALCRAYQADDRDRAALVTLAKEAKVQGWWQSYADAVPEWIKPLVTLEDEATEELHWAPTYVPGILQTHGYATAVMRAAETRADDDAIARMVDFRLKRQEVLARATPPHLWVIMDEGVLHRRVGGPSVMREQLADLRQRAAKPHVTVQVLPFTAGAHGADSAGFVMLRGPEPSLDVVYIGIKTAALYLEKDTELTRHRVVFEELRAMALSPDSSVELIAAVGEQYARAAEE